MIRDANSDFIGCDGCGCGCGCGEVESPQPALETLEDHSSRPSILIIDDDDDQSFALSRRLQQQGFGTRTAALGRRGLSLAWAEPPDLVLLDLRLPDMSGFDVCQELADEPATCGVPVIIVSGMEGPEIVRSCRAAGSRFFVRKPYDPNALLALIEHSLTDAW